MLRTTQIINTRHEAKMEAKGFLVLLAFGLLSTALGKSFEFSNAKKTLIFNRTSVRHCPSGLHRCSLRKIIKLYLNESYPSVAHESRTYFSTFSHSLIVFVFNLYLHLPEQMQIAGFISFARAFVKCFLFTQQRASLTACC